MSPIKWLLPGSLALQSCLLCSRKTSSMPGSSFTHRQPWKDLRKKRVFFLAPVILHVPLPHDTKYKVASSILAGASHWSLFSLKGFPRKLCTTIWQHLPGDRPKSHGQELLGDLCGYHCLLFRMFSIPPLQQLLAIPLMKCRQSPSSQFRPTVYRWALASVTQQAAIQSTPLELKSWRESLLLFPLPWRVSRNLKVFFIHVHFWKEFFPYIKSSLFKLLGGFSLLARP